MKQSTNETDQIAVFYIRLARELEAAANPVVNPIANPNYAVC